MRKSLLPPKNPQRYTLGSIIFLGSITCFLFLCQHAYHFTSLPPISFLSGNDHFLPCPRKYETFGTEKLIFPLHQMLLLFKLISRNTACVSSLHTLLFSHAKKSANNARDRISSCFCPVHVKVSCACCIKSRRKAGEKRVMPTSVKRISVLLCSSSRLKRGGGRRKKQL